MSSRVLIGVASLALVVALVAAWTLTGAPAPRTVLSKFPALYAVRGIDVSHHNGEIDWPQVAQSGLSFVYVKASEGGDRVDSRFSTNLEGARRSGLKVGAYHFFTFCRPGDDQANTSSHW